MEVHHGGLGLPTAAEEVTLREFTLCDADAEAFMSWASDPRVARFQRRDAYAHVDEARRYIADHVLPHPWYRAICVGAGADRAVVGSISVKPAAAEEGRLFRASVGYRVAHAHWGLGVATRAVRAAAEAVFAAWPWLRRLEAVADVENPASQRVLEKAGFVREGVLRRYILLKGRPRDMVMFSLVDTDRRALEGPWTPMGRDALHFSGFPISIIPERDTSKAMASETSRSWYGCTAAHGSEAGTQL
ncbi:hypothetical protein BS78_01G133800 [Paspalum vaginatum]|nr:hypothetical protein BS78_01G133800 [Paspalum vaginatum]